MLSSVDDSAFSSSPSERTHRARLASFLGLMVLAAIFFICVEVAAFWLFQERSYGLAVLVTAFCLIWILRARSAIQHNDMRRAILMTAVAFFSVPLVAVAFWPEIRPTIILLPLMVVAVAFPYLPRVDLLRLALLAWAIIMASSVISELVAQAHGVPGWYVSFLRTSSLASVSALLLLLFWLSGSRIKELFLEIREANKALSMSEGHFRATFEQAAVGIAHVSSSGRWLRVNQKLCSIVGYSAEELQARSVQEVTCPEDVAVDLAHMQGVLDGEADAFTMEKRFIRKDGTPTWVNLSVSLVRDSDRKPDYFLAVVEDIAARKQAEVERDQLMLGTQRAVQLRDEFFIVAAHELKTPITTLLGSAQLLQRRLADAGLAREQRAAGALIDQVHRLSRLSAALLDVTRMQEHGLRLTLAPLDLRDVVRQIVDEFVPTLSHHELDLRISSLPCRIRGDRLRLEQILQNVLHNAIKYSPEGGTIVVAVEPQSDHVRLSVADPGLGIPHEELEHIFGRFYRATNIKGLALAGMGVGLYIVHELVQLHGGEISVQSEQGRGTCFVMTFPSG